MLKGMNGYVVKSLNMPELELLRKCFCYIEDDCLSRKVLRYELYFNFPEKCASNEKALL